MTTCKVHNVRFYKLKPKGIHCMAYKKNEKKLALSRSDAAVEIWNLLHTPHVEKTIPSYSNASIEALCWFGQRLFSVGLTGQLVEYDLLKVSQKYAFPITGGAGWCMDIHVKNAHLVIGTEQGYFNLFTITDEGVEYVKIFDKQDGRVLCLKFDVTGYFVASGSVDTVRIWNVASGHAIHKMNIARSHTNVETVVWSLVITDDFTVISGDSRGFITFWDGEIGSQVESYQSHVAGVLTLCLSDNKKTVYCAGVDPVIMSYEKIFVKGGNQKWVKSIQRKIHDHDVRSLVLIDDKLYSAGIDGYLACSYYPPRTLVRYPPLLQNPCVSVAADARFVLLRYQTYLEVWQLGKESSEEKAVGFLQLEEEPKKLLVLQTKGEEGTICASLSNNGEWIVYSTCNKLRVFRFNYNDGSPELTSISNLPSKCTSCVRAVFSPDNKQLILASREGGLQILNISGEQLFMSQIIDTTSYIKDTITFLSTTSCGKYIVVADPGSNIASWTLTDTWKHHCTLPRYKSAPTALGVQPKSNNLLVVYADHKIIEYNLERRKFTDFSRGLDERHPRQWLNRSFPVISVTYDPRAEHIVLLHDDANICVIDKDKKLPKTNAKIPKIGSSSQDGSNCAIVSEHAFHIVKKNKHLAYFGWITDGEMVSVEVSPLSLMESLPPCLEKKKFGTK